MTLFCILIITFKVWEQVRDQMQRVEAILRALDEQWVEEMEVEEDYDYHDEL